MLSLLIRLASSVVGGLLPVFFSYKVLKKEKVVQKSLMYWSKYWAVYGTFMAMDVFLDTFYLTYLIPFYEPAKLLFLIWAVSPYTAGAQFVFDKVLAPFIRRNERQLEKLANGFVNKAMDYGPSFALQSGKVLWAIVTSVQLSLGKNEFDAIADVPHGVVSKATNGNSKTESTNQRHDVIVPDLSKVKIECQDSDDEVEYLGSYQYTPVVHTPAVNTTVRRSSSVVQNSPVDDVVVATPPSELNASAVAARQHDINTSNTSMTTADCKPFERKNRSRLTKTKVKATPSIVLNESDELVENEETPVEVNTKGRALRPRAHAVTALRKLSRSRTRQPKPTNSEASV